jgi:hypothetical protein
LPATWAVADPAISAATDRILADSRLHEIAVLGDGSWVGATAGRSRFGNELQRRVTHGRAAGLDIRSLVLRDTDLDDHSDLVVKLGIQTIAVPHKSRNRIFRSDRSLPAVQQVRFGLWKIPVINALPTTRLSLFRRRLNIRNQIARAASVQSSLEIGISALNLAVQRGAFAWLEAIFRDISQRRDQKTLEVATQAGLIGKILPERQIAPAHSILRPAA